MKLEKKETTQEKTVLRELREQLGYTQQQFATRLGIATRTLWQWESGKVEPSFTVKQLRILRFELARAGISLDDLLEYDSLTSLASSAK
jgi:transcriptional regulator with XRE-family HTH domain